MARIRRTSRIVDNLVVSMIDSYSDPDDCEADECLRGRCRCSSYALQQISSKPGMYFRFPSSARAALIDFTVIS